MSSNTNTVVDDLARLSKLRADQAANAAALAEQTAELDRLEAALAEEKRRAQHEQSVEQQQQAFDIATAAYVDSIGPADQAVEKLETMIDELARQFRSAVDAELLRHAAARTLRAHAQGLAGLSVDAPMPDVRPSRLHHAEPGSQLHGAQIVTFAADPAIEADLAQLAGKPYKARDARIIGHEMGTPAPGQHNMRRDPLKHRSPWTVSN